MCKLTSMASNKSSISQMSAHGSNVLSKSWTKPSSMLMDMLDAKHRDEGPRT